MASASGKIKIFGTSMSVITEYESPVDFAPSIFSQYYRGEFIQVFNGTWFMTDLSKVPEILPKPVPLYFGLRIFDTVQNEPIITYSMTGNTGNVVGGYTVSADHTLRYIDSGEDYYQIGQRNEEYNSPLEPRSNTELYTTVNRSDIDGFDYPQFTVRGTRKIPLSGDSLCGPESLESNRSTYNWYFGINAGLNFNPIETGQTPTAITGSVISAEGSSVISDRNGDLLFYTDGETVYTSGNTVMVNGAGLNGNTGSTQSSLIVPKPNSNNYYIFTTNYDGANNGFNYSVVNMDSQGGDGSVTTKNNSLLLNGLTEKVAGAKHGNGTDYWAITHKTGDSKFYSYKVTSAGLTAPVITNIGSINNTPRGYLKVSHDTTKIVNALYDEDIIDIMDFSSSAGTLSNLITITGFTFDNGPYGVEFSNDSSKLYISDGAQGKVYQFDLTYTASTDMVDYSIVVANITGNTNGSLQMGPDAKIYVANYEGNTLHVIHHPDGLGVNCNFQEDSIALYSGTTSQWGLPNFINDSVLSCDRYVYIRPNGDDIFNFDYTINDVTGVVQDKELNFYSEVHKYDNANSIFTAEPIFRSSGRTYNSFSSSTTTNISIFDIGEGEFLIKGYFEHPVHTFVGKQLNYRIDTIDTRKNGTEYSLYNPTTDWYFLNMYEADIPFFNNDQIGSSSVIGSLIVTSFFTTAGVSGYTYDGIGDAIVSYNGSTLGEDIDYSITGSSITFNFEVLGSQVVTLAFMQSGTDGLYIDKLVPTSYNSGPTNTQTLDDKLFYNTTESKFEYYLDADPQGSVSFIINGSMLINDVEYYRSLTDSRRIILEVSINIGDIIQAYYIPQVGYVGSITTTTPNVAWSIDNEPLENQNGTFTLEYSDFDDKTFDVILYTSDVEYVTGQRSYSSAISLSGGTIGDKFLYRVKNEKRYTPISGDVVTSTVISTSQPIILNVNSVNAY